MGDYLVDQDRWPRFISYVTDHMQRRLDHRNNVLPVPKSFKQIAASIVTLMVDPMLIRIGNCAKEKWLIETWVRESLRPDDYIVTRRCADI